MCLIAQQKHPPTSGSSPHIVAQRPLNVYPVFPKLIMMLAYGTFTKKEKDRLFKITVMTAMVKKKLATITGPEPAFI